MISQALYGLTIAVTRPQAQAEVLAEFLRSHGAKVLEFPLLAIDALSNEEIDEHCDRDALAGADGIIFVSANAVDHGVPAISRRGGMPQTATIYAIGDATAARLAEADIANAVVPVTGNDSEGLLALPALSAVAGESFVLVRGLSEGGGRQLLADTLTARGARVTSLNCYTRRALTLPQEARERLVTGMTERTIHAISVLSVDTLASLITNTGSASVSSGCMMLVPHIRIAGAVRAMGLTRVAVAPMGADALVLALTYLKPVILMKL